MLFLLEQRGHLATLLLPSGGCLVCVKCMIRHHDAGPSHVINPWKSSSQAKAVTFKGHLHFCQIKSSIVKKLLNDSYKVKVSLVCVHKEIICGPHIYKGKVPTEKYAFVKINKQVF